MAEVLCRIVPLCSVSDDRCVQLPCPPAAVLLQRGVPGGGIEGGGTAKQAAYTALMYDPDKPAGQRLTTLATSGIHR